MRVFDDATTAELENRTDWARLAALTEDELAHAVRVPNTRRIRENLHTTQEEFAAEFHISLDTLRDWKQGTVFPNSAARTLLRVIEKNLTAVLEAPKN